MSKGKSKMAVLGKSIAKERNEKAKKKTEMLDIAFLGNLDVLSSQKKEVEPKLTKEDVGFLSTFF